VYVKCTVYPFLLPCPFNNTAAFEILKEILIVLVYLCFKAALREPVFSRTIPNLAWYGVFCSNHGEP